MSIAVFGYYRIALRLKPLTSAFSQPFSSIRLSLVMPGHIRTSLFAHMKPFNTLAAFLLPLQEPSAIAEAIVATLEKEEGGILCLPKVVGIGWLWRGLPSWVSDGLRWVSELVLCFACVLNAGLFRCQISQADSSMSDFHKRPIMIDGGRKDS